MKTFYLVLVNSLIASVTNNFVWFALVFWGYLETQTVLATSFISGIYLVATALSGFWFGSIVDHNKKRTAMLISSLFTLAMFILALAMIALIPKSNLTSISDPTFWGFVIVILVGVIAGSIRNIALPTLVTILIEENKRDRANGLTGTVTGVSFAVTSVASGLALANFGMIGVLVSAILFTIISLAHLLFISIPEKKILHANPSSEVISETKKLDIKGTIAAIVSVPGLFGLIFFTTFNNFIGGVFMSLMDAYALTLVRVDVWGILLGIISPGFIIGGLIIAKKGLGKNPLRTMFMINIAMWCIAAVFTLQPWIWLLAVGMFLWMLLVPFVEATEHTIIQKVVPLERQGRVFGFAQSVEQAASPITAFIIGPIAHFIFIPFMTTGMGVTLIGDWYGVGVGRGIGLVFTITGIIGLLLTLVAIKSKSYRLLSKRYAE